MEAALPRVLRRSVALKSLLQREKGLFMSYRNVAGIAILLTLALVARGAEPIDTEACKLLEQVKSRDTAVRTAAVGELIGLRQAVSDSLRLLVSDGDHQVVPAIYKSHAIYLIGELGLVQCRDVLSAQKDWVPDYRDLTGTSLYITGRFVRGQLDFLLGDVAHRAEGRLAAGANVTARPAVIPIDIAKYPVLASALNDLRLDNLDTRLSGQDVVKKWYDTVVDGLLSILSSLHAKTYPQEVRITAVYLLGEFRPWAETDLLRAIGLEDRNGVCAAYPSSLQVTTTDTSYPCVVALLKCDRRVSISSGINALANKSLSLAARERIARTMMAIDPNEAKREYDNDVARVRQYPENTIDPAAVSSMLAEVAPIFAGQGS